MKVLKQVAVGVLLAWSALFLVAAASIMMTPHEKLTQEDTDAALGCVLLGLPPAAIGTWLAWGMYRQVRKEREEQQENREEQLRSLFFQLLQENNGNITVLRFAMESKVPAAEAKLFLDQQATAFNATFDVSEDGGISYHFNL